MPQVVNTAFWGKGLTVHFDQIQRQPNTTCAHRLIAFAQQQASKTDSQVEDTAEAQARAMGIQGVPLFVVNGTHAVSGAQRPETFVDLIQQALHQQRLETDSTDGAACAVDGSNC